MNNNNKTTKHKVTFQLLNKTQNTSTCIHAYYTHDTGSHTTMTTRQIMLLIYILPVTKVVENSTNIQQPASEKTDSILGMLEVLNFLVTWLGRV